MCGIVACRRRERALDFILPALHRLEYRGYDSAGVAVTARTGSDVKVVRSVGRIAGLEETLAARSDLAGGIALGHTRWATHGAVTVDNAHPHVDCTGEVAVVHNGIIENAAALRIKLEATGHVFASDVDSEVIAHLVEEERSLGADLGAAVRAAVRLLEGSWAIAVVSEGCDHLVLARYRSPLVVANTEDGDFAASDMAAVAGWADRVRVLADGDVVEMNGQVLWSDAHGRPRLAAPPVTPPWRIDEVDLTDYTDYMAKEIAEQPAVAERLLDDLLPALWGGSAWGPIDLGAVERVRLIGCGTSLNAASITARMLRVVARVPVDTVVASEQDDWLPLPGTLNVAFSQSGETADVLTALERVAGPVLAVTNSPHSSLALRADAVLPCLAGPEIGVAASKTFTAQVLSGAILALGVGRARGVLNETELRSVHELLLGVPERLEEALSAQVMAEVVADFVEQAPGFLFVSRGAGVPYAAEGALKLKELTYRWAESFAAGELKHGPIALIGQGTPVVVVESEAAPKLASNIAEMQARGAHIVRVGPSPEAVLRVPSVPAPWGPLESVVALQHLARSLGRRLGLDVDKPRNLAKCVTVE